MLFSPARAVLTSWGRQTLPQQGGNGAPVEPLLVVTREERVNAWRASLHQGKDSPMLQAGRMDVVRSSNWCERLLRFPERQNKRATKAARDGLLIRL